MKIFRSGFLNYVLTFCCRVPAIKNGSACLLWPFSQCARCMVIDDELVSHPMSIIYPHCSNSFVICLYMGQFSEGTRNWRPKSFFRWHNDQLRCHCGGNRDICAGNGLSLALANGAAILCENVMTYLDEENFHVILSLKVIYIQSRLYPGISTSCIYWAPVHLRCIVTTACLIINLLFCYLMWKQ